MSSHRQAPARPDIRADLPRTSALFGRIRRGLRVRAAIRALEPAAAAGLVFWVASVVTDAALSLPAAARLVALTVTCAAAAAAFLWFLLRGAAGRIGPVYLAARAEALYPRLAGRLIAAVELASSAARSEGDEGAARLVREQAEALVSEIDPARVVAAEAPRATAHKYLLWSMALVLGVAVVTGSDFPDLVARSLFPWLSPESPEAAFFWIRPTAVEVEEGERFSVGASVRGQEPKRVALQLALGVTEGAGPHDSKERPAGAGGRGSGRSGTDGIRSIRMERDPVPQRWSAEAGPVERSGSYRLVAEYGRKVESLESEWFPVRLLRRPRVRSMSVEYEYPRYTGRAARRESGGAIDAPAGTVATVELVPEGPLGRATAVVDGRRVAMRRVAQEDGPGEAWRFKVEVRRSGSYRIDLESVDGVRTLTGPHPVIARADRAPRCDASFMTPADGGAEISSRGAAFRVWAADDFGLEEVVLVVRREGRPGARRERTSPAGDVPPDGPPGTYYIPVPGFAAGAREFSRELRVPPQVLPVEPGVTYTYYVRAADGLPPSPHLVTSLEKTFRISRRTRPKALLAHARSRKRRPRLLEPADDEPNEPLGPRAGGGPAGAGKDSSRRPSRSLAGLDDGGRRTPATPGPHPRPKRSKSPYASAPGLGEKEREKAGPQRGKEGGRRGAGAPKETASAGPPGSAGGPGGAGGPESAGGKRRGEKAQLPGQRTPSPGRAPERERTAAGDTAPGGAGGASGSSGSRRPRAAPDATGSGPEGGGRAKAGLKEKRPRDGGVPTGAETGTASPIPETVDEEAVAALTPAHQDLTGVRAPSAASRFGKDRSGRTVPARDLGRGLGRRVGPAGGRDRVMIPRDAIPTPEVIRSRPVSRMYRALVSEYFRRLEELASDR